MNEYAREGQRLWSMGIGAHGRWHGCFYCAEARAYLGIKPLVSGAANLFGMTLIQSFEQREERAS